LNDIIPPGFCHLWGYLAPCRSHGDTGMLPVPKQAGSLFHQGFLLVSKILLKHDKNR
jgi:hypothetical protein